MLKRIIAAALSLCSVQMQAQSLFDFFTAPHEPVTRQSPKEVEFEYDIDFQYYFDNREFTVSDNRYDCSRTLNAAVLTPSVGFSFQQGRDVNHRLMAGIDIWKNMGESPVIAGVESETDPSLSNWKLFREMTLYYDAHVRFDGGGCFEGVAGAFPRAFTEGEYGQAFYSDATRFLDRNLEGVLLKYRSNAFYAETGCDWMGMKGVSRKERFEVFTAGCWSASDWLSLGWAGSFYHYAGSENAPGVVDNHLVNPYVKADFGSSMGLEELSLKAGYLVTYQRDRLISKTPYTKGGFQADINARKRSFGVNNITYLGSDLNPYYDYRDSGGNLYGDALYRGSHFYSDSFYDRAELYWEPRISDFLSLKLSAVFHFAGSGYQGCQQIFSLVFDLDAIRNPSCRSGIAGKPSRKKGISITDFDVLPL